MNKVFIASCRPRESVYEGHLRRLAGLSRGRETVFTDSPAQADLILIVDIDDHDLHNSVRRNRVWMRYPAKSFGLDEDGWHAPPRFLHGVYNSVSRSESAGGRFQTFGYYIHQQRFPNPCPDPERVWTMPKDLLFSFSGRNCHAVRERLFQQVFPTRDVLLEDTSNYNHFQAEPPVELARKHQEGFWNTAMRSKFALCPRGAGPASIRLFEMMEAGIAPVIISDEWCRPLGPAWEQFALFVAEKDVGDLYQIVKVHEDEYRERGRMARKAFEDFFAPDQYWEGLLKTTDYVANNQTMPEASYAWTVHFWVLWQRLKRQRIKWGTRLKRYF